MRAYHTTFRPSESTPGAPPSMTKTPALQDSRAAGQTRSSKGVPGHEVKENFGWADYSWDGGLPGKEDLPRRKEIIFREKKVVFPAKSRAGVAG